MRTIVITGASKGLGKALFEQSITTPNTQTIGIARSFKRKKIANAETLRLDLSKPTDVFKLEKYLEKKIFKTNDELVFVHNAAIVNPIGPFGKLDRKEIIAHTHLNITSSFLIANALISIQKTHKIKITFIQLGSGAGYRAIPGWSLYCSSKAANKMMIETMSLDFKKNKKIRLCYFSPGVLDTDMQKNIRSSSSKNFPQVQEFKKLKSEGRLSQPEDVAKKIIKIIEWTELPLHLAASEVQL